MNIVENMRLTSINAKIRNFKNEKILNFLVESGPDLLRIDDPVRIAIELRNRSAWPEPGRAGLVKKKFGPSPARPAFGQARLTLLVYIQVHFCNRYFIITIDLDSPDF